ncbi:hypothetical protein MYK68_14160 [Gordonia sp. PP30]|uniref:hypothetical protein n=1 Tax=Gordonia sp. PP30 TaxID=2935861 RepID=UPI001FFEF95C|nr:hypothetical protein [Gordonia sp. PP30]UQE73875.1 hypothetical protein MYK68_14160 [Gordonia sp. PP30]
MNATTLQDLIQKARDAGMSYRQMEDKVARAEEKNPRGMRISRATANNIARGRHSGPVSDEVIRAVAYLAEVPDQVAFAAAGRRTDGPPFASELPVGVDDLQPHERRVAIDFLRLLVSQRQELNRHERTAAHADPPAPEPGTPRAPEPEDKKIRVTIDSDGTLLIKPPETGAPIGLARSQIEAILHDVLAQRDEAADAGAPIDWNFDNLVSIVQDRLESAFLTWPETMPDKFRIMFTSGSSPASTATHLESGYNLVVHHVGGQKAEAGDGPRQSDYDLASYRTRHPNIAPGDPGAYEDPGLPPDRIPGDDEDPA